MAKFLLFLLLTLLPSCSLDSFDYLYNLTSSLKENVAIASGLVDVDTSELVETVKSAVEDFSPLAFEDGITINGYFVKFELDDVEVGQILPPLDQSTLFALDSASTNSIKVKAATEALSSPLEDEKLELTRNTIAFINAFIGCFAEEEDFESLSYVFEGFKMNSEQELVERDLLSLRILIYVFGSSLSYFDADSEDPVTVEAIMEAMRNRDNLTSTYIDSVALALGRAKSAGKAIGDSSFVNSLNNVLTYFLEAV